MIDKQLTPLMRQYFTIKENYPDTILLFQVGDFYELFFEDAQKAATILGIALTQRGTHKGEPIPLCGVPLHVIDHYLTKLVRAGLKVALCDQLEQPKPGKVVDRGVTQVLTPGTLTDSKLLDDKSASYLAVFYPSSTTWTVLFVELLTGQLFITLLKERSLLALEAELMRFMPAEILISDAHIQEFQTYFQRQGFVVSAENNVLKDEAIHWFGTQFPLQNSSLDKALIADALSVMYSYLKRNNEQGLQQIKQLAVYKSEDYLILDAATQRNLDLVKNSNEHAGQHTLFSVLDKAVTPMGSRMLKKWLVRPLMNKESIEERLDAVEHLLKDNSFRSGLRQLLSSVGDVERIVGRIALKRAHLHDYTALLLALSQLPSIKKSLSSPTSHLLESMETKIADFTELISLLDRSLNSDRTKEWLIKEGFDAQLDKLRGLVEQSATALHKLEEEEQKKTGISSLKIRYNQVHGYAIEITTANKDAVPERYIRTQTLANRERFTTQELKDLEYEMKRAQSDIGQVEKQVYEKVKLVVEDFLPHLKKTAYVLAYLDCLGSLAEVASVYKYVRPTFTDDQSITISEGRHPVVETRLHSGFIPNCVTLNNASSLWIITGPNMGGKSTFLRQVALITLMGQLGSFVPAARAELALVDRIFTRIGASDNVAEGKSTFLVEMEETAQICNQATARSLVILDEVGRGTSTFDGLALAQAVVEYIYTKVGARCLFATHYHELTTLSSTYSGIQPHYAASMKTAHGIVLLHKIMPGIADGSFGIDVAVRAGLPNEIISRARTLLKELSSSESHKSSFSKHSLVEEDTKSTPKEHFLAAELLALDTNDLTPKQAFDVLWSLKERLKQEQE